MDDFLAPSFHTASHVQVAAPAVERNRPLIASGTAWSARGAVARLPAPKNCFGRMQKLMRPPSTSSLGSTTSGSSGGAMQDASQPTRLSSRLPEKARRARARRDWTPPTWRQPLSTVDKGLLGVYLVLYFALWVALFGREALYGRAPPPPPPPCTCDRPRQLRFLVDDLGLQAQCQPPFNDPSGDVRRTSGACEEPDSLTVLESELALPGHCSALVDNDMEGEYSSNTVSAAAVALVPIELPAVDITGGGCQFRGVDMASAARVAPSPAELSAADRNSKNCQSRGLDLDLAEPVALLPGELPAVNSSISGCQCKGQCKCKGECRCKGACKCQQRLGRQEELFTGLKNSAKHCSKCR